MSIHPAYLQRFAMLDGLTSFEQVRSDPALEARFHEFMQWRETDPPPQVTTRDTTVAGPHGPVPVRVYGEGDGTGRPALVWMHGGAFMMGDLDMPEADRTAREVAARAGAVVVSVDYRLAVGGVTYPVPLDDCVAAFRWTRSHAEVLGIDPARITVGGASAGANLAGGTALRLRDDEALLPAALLAAYPAFYPELPPASDALTALLADLPPVLRMSAEGTAAITRNYLGRPLDQCDGYAMPGLADLSGLCPTVVITAEYDDLRPSGERFVGALAAAGCDVTYVCLPSVLHGFLNLPPEIQPVDDAFGLIAGTVARARVTDPQPART
jgi:acetyl esterase/lipase